jgi:hypothetical protein
MDISNTQFFVAIAVAPLGTLIYAVVASMANNRRAEEIKTGISERIGLLDRDVASLKADLATASTALASVKTELKNDIAVAATRTDSALRDLKADLRSDLKEFRVEIRADLKDAVAQIRSDLANRKGQASSGH